MQYYKLETEDTVVHGVPDLLNYLWQCKNNNCNIYIELTPEGPCGYACGLYAILDSFCNASNYDPSCIFIKTSNLIECHDHYNIQRVPCYAFDMTQKYAKEIFYNTGTTPRLKFGNFNGQSRWSRLWLASWLDKHHGEQTLQTYHGGYQQNYRTDQSDNAFDTLGFEDLNQFGCTTMSDAAKFLEKCPITIEKDMEKVRSMPLPEFNQLDYYPLKHPAVMSIGHWYEHIFVDIVAETHFTGNSFKVTEKTYRAMLARRPFIVAGNRNFLYNLQKLGFKTFWKYWNEDYDGQGQQTRMYMMFDVINDIAKLKQEECWNMLDDMQDILEHNYQTFMNLKSKNLLTLLDNYDNY